MIGVSFRAQQKIFQMKLPASNYDSLAEDYKITKTRADDDDRTIGALQQQVSKLESVVPSANARLSVISQDLENAKFLAGLTDVTGPGVIVTLNDSKKRFPDAPLAVQMGGIVHDTDINQVINELKAAGAEAVSLNDERVVALTAVRCAGPTVYCNNSPQTPPYVIQAIGDPTVLAQAMRLPGGIYDQLSDMDPEMIRISQAKTLHLAAYNGATQPRYAKPVPVSVTTSTTN